VCPPDAAALFIDRSQRIGESLQLGISLNRGDGIAFERPRRTP
jgi:hemoglobin